MLLISLNFSSCIHVGAEVHPFILPQFHQISTIILHQIGISTQDPFFFSFKTLTLHSNIFLSIFFSSLYFWCLIFWGNKEYKEKKKRKVKWGNKKISLYQHQHIHHLLLHHSTFLPGLTKQSTRKIHCDHHPRSLNSINHNNCSESQLPETTTTNSSLIEASKIHMYNTADTFSSIVIPTVAACSIPSTTPCHSMRQIVTPKWFSNPPILFASLWNPEGWSQTSWSASSSSILILATFNSSLGLLPQAMFDTVHLYHQAIPFIVHLRKRPNFIPWVPASLSFNFCLHLSSSEPQESSIRISTFNQACWSPYRITLTR